MWSAVPLGRLVLGRDPGAGYREFSVVSINYRLDAEMLDDLLKERAMLRAALEKVLIHHAEHYTPHRGEWDDHCIRDGYAALVEDEPTAGGVAYGCSPRSATGEPARARVRVPGDSTGGLAESGKAAVSKAVDAARVARGGSNPPPSAWANNPSKVGSHAAYVGVQLCQ